MTASQADPGARLGDPLTLGGVQLRNRIALPATLTNYAREHRITERWSQFLVERARGGCGLIVTEIIAVDPEALAHGAVVIGYDDRNDAAFAQTAAQIQAAGARVVGQLWHPGRQQLWQPTRSPMGVSDQPDAYSWTVPHVMSGEDLERLAEAFVATAERLSRLGFDGVELHGAHGYLITQLLSPWSNTRDDAYGGTVDNRARFCANVARGIRERCRPGFAVGLKMPALEGVDGGIDVAEARAITARLASSGDFDYFAYGQGNFSWSLEDHVPDLHYRPGHFLDAIRAVRSAAGGVPVMALGRIGKPALAMQVVAEGYGDLVGIGRAQVSDAAFASKALSGRADDIRPCVYNNYCWGEVHAGRPLAEFHNPHLAAPGEASWRPEPAQRRRRVAVIGAGPAGLEAGWVAAARGHRVTVYGASAEAGGKLRREAALPGLQEMGSVIDYQVRLCDRYGVRWRLGTLVTPETMATLDAEVLILATGAELREPALHADGSVPVVSARELADSLDARDDWTGRTAVLFDQDHTAATYAAADLLAARFEHTLLVTPRTQIAQGVNYCSAIGIHRRLHCAGVEIVTASAPRSALNGAVTLVDAFSGVEKRVEDTALLVYATPRRVNDRLAAHAGEGELHLIGDCMAPRNLMIAIHEGHALGLSL